MADGTDVPANAPADAVRTTSEKNITDPASLLLKNRIPASSFWGYLYAAAIVDGLSYFIPYIPFGTLFIGYCRLDYYRKRYYTKNMGWQTGIDAVIEAVPGIDQLPAATAWVVTTYATNVLNTRPVRDNKEGTGASRLSRIMAAGVLGTSIRRTLIGADASEEGAGKPGGPGEEDANAQKKSGKETPASSALGAADWNLDRAGIDGVKRPGAPANVLRSAGAGLPETPRVDSGLTDIDIDRIMPRGIDGIRDYRDAAQTPD